ncbi:hypothetical protein CFP56_028709 [Quercus suber]|uniref:Uncharacterized protein n=1 Tax=Quercus suber TaxID=58331 RepID=A0AAW0LXB6_QUESU
MRAREMGGFPCESESWVSSSSTTSIPENDTAFELVSPPPQTTGFLNQDEEWAKLNFANKNNLNMSNNNGSSLGKKKKSQVLLEWHVEAADDDDLSRTKSLTDEDLDELKGCLDLGFGFSYDEIPELCNTLPALELCYSMSQKFMDEQQKSPPESAQPPATTDSCSSVSSPIANWKISSPAVRTFIRASSATRRPLRLLSWYCRSKWIEGEKGC